MSGNGTAKGGYTAPVKLSEELADIVGGDEMPRHEVIQVPDFILLIMFWDGMVAMAGPIIVLLQF